MNQKWKYKLQCVECGCTKSTRAFDHKQAQEEFEGLGWVSVMGKGWHCPEHAKGKTPRRVW